MPSAVTEYRYHHGDLRNALIQGAERVLAEKGPVGLSLREVAKVAYVRLAMENPQITRLMFSGAIEPQDDKTYQVVSATA